MGRGGRKGRGGRAGVRCRWVTPLLALVVVAAAALLAHPAAARITAEVMQGLHGGAVFQGRYYAGDVMGQTLYSFALRGKPSPGPEIGAPWGEADDVAVRESDGLLAYTSIARGEVRVVDRNNRSNSFALPLKVANPIKFDAGSGRLFVGPCFFAAGLFEVDLAARSLVRLPAPAGNLMLNSFEAPGDGFIYGPDLAAGTVVRASISSGQVDVLASNFSHHFGVALGTGGAKEVYVLTGSPGMVERLRPVHTEAGSDGRGDPQGALYEEERDVVFRDASLLIDNFEYEREGHALLLTVMLPAGVLRVGLATGQRSWVFGPSSRAPATGGLAVAQGHLFASSTVGSIAMTPLPTPGGADTVGAHASLVPALMSFTPSTPLFAFAMAASADGTHLYTSCMASGTLVAYRVAVSPHGGPASLEGPVGTTAADVGFPRGLVHLAARGVLAVSRPVRGDIVLVADPVAGGKARDPSPVTPHETLASGLQQPWGLAIDPRPDVEVDAVFATERGAGRLLRVSLAAPDASDSGDAHGHPPVETILDGLVQPEGLGVVRLADGLLWAVVAEAGRARLLAVEVASARTVVLRAGLALTIDPFRGLPSEQLFMGVAYGAGVATHGRHAFVVEGARSDIRRVDIEAVVFPVLPQERDTCPSDGGCTDAGA